MQFLDTQSMKWSEEVLKILDRIPIFARAMARKSIEKRAKEIGANMIEESLVQAISNKMGMRKESSDNDKS